jgi:predicted GIY-YIG superfamily endonuclease
MIDQSEILYRGCKALVGLFRDQIEGRLECVHTRIFNYVIHPEMKYVYYGISKDAKSGAPTHPEHIVPCAVLINESFRLIKEGNLADDEIAKLLKKHWKIATISKDEAKRLDTELKLKSKMPEKWKFEDGDTFARLKVAGISIEKDEL